MSVLWGNWLLSDLLSDLLFTSSSSAIARKGMRGKRALALVRSFSVALGSFGLPFKTLLIEIIKFKVRGL